MTKAELLAEVATKSGLSKKDTENVVNTMLELIGDTLKTGQKVQISGFGVFTVSHRKGRIGRNPRTGEEIPIPAVKVAKFKAGRGLKEKLV